VIFNSPEIACKTHALKVINMTQPLLKKGTMEIAREGISVFWKISRGIVGSVRK